MKPLLTTTLNILFRQTLVLSLLLAIPSYLQVDNDFSPLKQTFEGIEKDHAGFTFNMDKREPLKLQIEFIVHGENRPEANLSLFVNQKRETNIPIKAIYTEHREKLIVPLSSFHRGENRIELKLENPGQTLAQWRVKLFNYYGINSHFPKTYVVFDDTKAGMASQGRYVDRFVGFMKLWILFFILTLACLGLIPPLLSRYATISIPISVLFLPSILLLWATWIYSAWTPFKIIYPGTSVIGGVYLLLAAILFFLFLIQRTKLVGEILAVLLITLALSEGVLRLYNIINPVFVFSDNSYNRFRGKPLSDMFGFRLNSRGFNDLEYKIEKKPGVTRILAIGDSFTFGVVPYKQNFLTLAEENLNRHSSGIELINMGIPAIGMGDYFSLLVNEGVALKPDKVILFFFVGNDFLADKKNSRDTFYLWSFLRFLIDLGIHYEGKVYGQEQDYEDDRATYTTAKFLTIEKNISWIFLRNNPTFQQALDRVLFYFNKIKAVCDHQGIDLLVALLPDTIQVDKNLQSEIIRASAITETDYDFSFPNTRLKGELEKLGIASFDFHDAFLRETSTGKPLYKPNGTHWNIAGNALAANVLETWLANYLVQ